MYFNQLSTQYVLEFRRKRSGYKIVLNCFTIRISKRVSGDNLEMGPRKRMEWDKSQPTKAEEVIKEIYYLTFAFNCYIIDVINKTQILPCRHLPLIIQSASATADNLEFFQFWVRF
jgi:hypothetical protein